MKPYFDTSHLAGALTLVAVLCWAMIEAAHSATAARKPPRSAAQAGGSPCGRS
jgi:hypothetical protein